MPRRHPHEPPQRRHRLPPAPRADPSLLSQRSHHPADHLVVVLLAEVLDGPLVLLHHPIQAGLREHRTGRLTLVALRAHLPGEALFPRRQVHRIQHRAGHRLVQRRARQQVSHAIEQRLLVRHLLAPHPVHRHPRGQRPVHQRQPPAVQVDLLSAEQRLEAPHVVDQRLPVLFEDIRQRCPGFLHDPLDRPPRVGAVCAPCPHLLAPRRICGGHRADHRVDLPSGHVLHRGHGHDVGKPPHQRRVQRPRAQVAWGVHRAEYHLQRFHRLSHHPTRPDHLEPLVLHRRCRA